MRAGVTSLSSVPRVCIGDRCMWYPAETRSVLPIELAVGLLVPGGWPDAMGEPKRRPQLDFGVRMARLRTNFGNGNGGKERRRRRVTAPLSV